MFSTKEKKRQIVVIPRITAPLAHWLKMDISSLGLIFSFSVRLHNTLLGHGINNLETLLFFSREGLTNGTGISKETFDKVSYDDQRKIEGLGSHLFNPTQPWKKKFGDASMKEINDMLKKLGLKLQGE